MDAKLLSLAEDLSAQPNLDGIWSVVCEHLADIGFPEVNWGHVDPATKPPSGAPVRSTMPMRLWRTYFERRDFEYDPIVAHFAESDEPFVGHFGWLDLEQIPEKLLEQKDIYGDYVLPARFGVAERTLGRTKIGILALGADVEPDAWQAHVARNLTLFTMAARICAAYLATVEPPADPQTLSAREAQCLLLLARGDRNDRIAERLGLHRATVEMHIVRARRKMGAKTREQAIARAVARGEISP